MSNRFQFLGADVDASGKKFVYILDTVTGETLESPVRGALVAKAEEKPAAKVAEPAKPYARVEDKKERDPAGDLMSPEDRAERNKKFRKVPPAFLGNIDRMSMDPGKTGGVTDIVLPK